MLTVTLNGQIYDKAKLNSMTKYPSILTYHKTAPRGGLLPELTEGENRADHVLFVTEKVDGANSRIVFFTNEDGRIKDFFIGSRENMLYVSGDRCFNEDGHIVENILTVAEEIITHAALDDVQLPPESIVTFYFEHFGGHNNGWKQYTAGDNYGARLFDIKTITYEDANRFLQMNNDQLAGARENDQIGTWYSVGHMLAICGVLGIRHVPYVDTMNGEDMPETLRDTYEWLKFFAESHVILDDKALGHAEGVVIRSENRTYIKKIRFEDYQKTERKGMMDLNEAV